MTSFIARRLQAIQPSATLAMAAKAEALKKEGKNIINLSIGEPDFDTEDNVKQAAIQAIKAGDTKYTNVDGTLELKRAICEKFKRENNIDYNVSQISVSSGAKQVIYNALLATLNPGDEVIIPSPYWVSYPDMVALAGGVPVFVSCPAEQSFKMLPEQLEAAINEKTKWVIFNSPSNPTGATYSREEIKALMQVLLAHSHVHLMVDDMYEHIMYDDFTFTTPAQVEPELYHRILTINGVSKAYAMTGWRIGYAGGPVELIKAMALVQSQTTSNPCSISQAASVEALSGTQDYVREHCASFQKRRDLMMQALASIENMQCIKPQGAFYLFPYCIGLIGKTTPAGQKLLSSKDIAAFLLEYACVAVVPGIAFGMEHCIRLSFATSEAIIEEACDNIRKACAMLI